jgi:hypothetical protein
VTGRGSRSCWLPASSRGSRVPSGRPRLLKRRGAAAAPVAAAIRRSTAASLTSRRSTAATVVSSDTLPTSVLQ